MLRRRRTSRHHAHTRTHTHLCGLCVGMRCQVSAVTGASWLNMCSASGVALGLRRSCTATTPLPVPTAAMLSSHLMASALSGPRTPLMVHTTCERCDECVWACSTTCRGTRQHSAVWRQVGARRVARWCPAAPPLSCASPRPCASSCGACCRPSRTSQSCAAAAPALPPRSPHPAGQNSRTGAHTCVSRSALAIVSGRVPLATCHVTAPCRCRTHVVQRGLGGRGRALLGTKVPPHDGAQGVARHQQGGCGRPAKREAVDGGAARQQRLLLGPARQLVQHHLTQRAARGL